MPEKENVDINVFEHKQDEEVSLTHPGEDAETEIVHGKEQKVKEYKFDPK